MFDPMMIPVNPAPESPPIAPPPPPPAMPAMAFKVEKPPKNQWSVSIVQRAQGIYPAEAQAKAAQVAAAKMPTSSGPWGKPQ